MRRQAIKLFVRKGYSFQSAWWPVYRDVEHRMEHWVQAVDHRELKFRPCPHSFGVSGSPQHRSGTAPLGGRPLEAGSPVTPAQRRTRTRYTAHACEQTFQRIGNHGKKSFGGRKAKACKGKGKKVGKKGQEAASCGAARSSTG